MKRHCFSDEAIYARNIATANKSKSDGMLVHPSHWAWGRRLRFADVFLVNASPSPSPSPHLSVSSPPAAPPFEFRLKTQHHTPPQCPLPIRKRRGNASRTSSHDGPRDSEAAAEVRPRVCLVASEDWSCWVEAYGSPTTPCSTVGNAHPESSSLCFLATQCNRHS
jgi:hypothetical protein